MSYSTALPPGLMVGEYKILKELGHGTFGITYLAINKTLDLKVAIKEYFPNAIAVRGEYCEVLPKSQADREDYNWGLQQFLSEAKTLATFDHPNIVKVHRYFELHSTAYFVMSYTPGRSLGDALKEIEEKGESITEEDVELLLFPLFGALKLIHSKGCLHRDIKPDNIYLRDDNSQPMLLDFGAARFSLGQHSKSISTILTPGYAPVEQYQSSAADQGPWTDIYALAATMYRTITGKVPPDAFDRFNAIADTNKDSLPSIYQTSNGKFSTQFLTALMYGLHIRKEQRPQTAMEWKGVFFGGKIISDNNTKNSNSKSSKITIDLVQGKSFDVLEHPVLSHKAVKKGFSWGMFFAGFVFTIILVIVLGVKKMWGHMIGVFVILLSTVFLTPTGEEGFFITVAITTVISILYGIKGNEWLLNSLISRGYNRIETVSSPNPEAAVAIAVKNKA